MTKVGLTGQEHADIMSSLSGWQTKDQWIREAVQEKLSGQAGTKDIDTPLPPRSQILQLLEGEKALTRAEIANRLGISDGWCTNILGQLVNQRLIKNISPNNRRTGQYTLNT